MPCSVVGKALDKCQFVVDKYFAQYPAVSVETQRVLVWAP